MEYNVFLSWSGKASEEAGRTFSTFLPHFLLGVNFAFSPWMSKGEDPYEWIEKNIQQSDFFIAFLSKESLKSSWQKKEYLLAKEKNVPCSALLLDVDISDLPFIWTDLQVTKLEKEDVWLLVKTLLTTLGGDQDFELIFPLFSSLWGKFISDILSALNKTVRLENLYTRQELRDLGVEHLQSLRAQNEDVFEGCLAEAFDLLSGIPSGYHSEEVRMREYNTSFYFHRAQDNAYFYNSKGRKIEFSKVKEQREKLGEEARKKWVQAQHIIRVVDKTYIENFFSNIVNRLRSENTPFEGSSDKE